MLRVFFLAICLQSLTIAAQITALGEGATFTVIKANPEGRMAGHGDYFRFNASMISQADSTLFSTKRNGAPQLTLMDTLNKNPVPVVSALELMRVGEVGRISFLLSNFPMKPPGMEEDSIIYYEVEFLEIVSQEEYNAEKSAEEKRIADTKAALKKREAEVLAFHKKVLTDYQAGSLTALDTTGSGLRYIIHERGEGEVPEKGDKIAVHYIGSLAEGEAEPFDQSFSRGEPIEFSVGTGRVIPGWDEGLMLLPRGSRATFFIPSEIAYGERGAGSVIPSGAELVFYVELLEKK